MPDTQQIAELGRLIQTHLGTGRLREARDLLIEYCRLNSGDAAAWAALGQLHDRHGESEQAASCLERAVALQPRNAAARMQLAAINKRLGKLQAAACHCRAALEMNPEPVGWWWELGDLSAQLEDFPTVERCCRAVLDRNPSYPSARLYLGIALQRQRRLHEAEEVLRTALADAPADPEAYFNLGLVLQTLGDSAGALQHFRSALDFGLESGALMYNMGLLHYQQGSPGDALEWSYRALQCEPGSLKYRQLFVRTLHAAVPASVSEDMRAEILRCFNCKGIDSIYLMKPVMMLLIQNEQLQLLVELAGHGEYDRIGSQNAVGGYDALFRDQLLMSLLLYTSVVSSKFEKVLCALRRTALVHVMQPGKMAETALFSGGATFAVALAGQFFNTGYAADIDPHEAEQVAMLAEVLRDSSKDDATDSKTLLNRLIVMCMYQPLYSIPDVERLVESRLQSVDGYCRHLLETQWLAYLAENEQQQHLTRLTTVTDMTSLAVREQYEQLPYPRWETVMLCEPLAVDNLFAEMCPGCTPPEVAEGTPEVLIAGCGTGRHAIMSASLYGCASVLAVDLSARSLAYAMRKAEELGIENLRFAQADILELGGIDRIFHIIESVGVLHHLQNPEHGLRVLTGLMPPNGMIRLGLYSKAGRQDVAAARALIAARGIEPTVDGIRRARAEIMALPEDRLERRVTRFRDFFSMNGCRDLLFHVQEWCFDLAEVAGLLDRTGLRFTGFQIEDHSIRATYLERFPDDPDLLNLDNWQTIEAEFPETFSEMYQFWCQKIC